MAGDRSASNVYQAAAVLLSVLCIGVAAGALLGGGGAVPPRSPSVPASVPPVADTAAAPRTEPIVQDTQAWPEPAEIPAAEYAPVAGAVGPSSAPFADALPGAALVPDTSAMPARSEPRVAAVAPVVGVRDVAERQHDNVASLGSAMAARALLFAVATGEETILFDVGVPGARVLPDNISGAWSWVGSCTRVWVEISQLPGARTGSVRGVGSGSAGDRFGWVVPASGCGAAPRSSRSVPSAVPTGAPPNVVTLEPIDSAPCESGSACHWFVGLDAGRRAVALLARAGGDHWIQLGTGGFR